MSTYDQRMEESEKKLHDRLEDFEAERRDAELAFKVLLRSYDFHWENHQIFLSGYNNAKFSKGFMMVFAGWRRT